MIQTTAILLGMLLSCTRTPVICLVRNHRGHQRPDVCLHSRGWRFPRGWAWCSNGCSRIGSPESGSPPGMGRLFARVGCNNDGSVHWLPARYTTAAPRQYDRSSSAGLVGSLWKISNRECVSTIMVGFIQNNDWIFILCCFCIKHLYITAEIWIYDYCCIAVPALTNVFILLFVLFHFLDTFIRCGWIMGNHLQNLVNILPLYICQRA